MERNEKMLKAKIQELLELEARAKCLIEPDTRLLNMARESRKAAEAELEALQRAQAALRA